VRPDFDEIRTLTKRFALIPQKVAKFVFGVFRYADLSVLGDYKLRKAIKLCIAGNSKFISGVVAGVLDGPTPMCKT